WLYREDVATAQLLGDLADAAADSGQVYLTGDAIPHPLVDNIAVGGPELIDLMAAHQVTTVADLYAALASSVGEAATSATIDLDGDGTNETSDLDAAFLMHGFYPIADLDTPSFTLGDRISRTDHLPAVSGGLVPREHMPE